MIDWDQFYTFLHPHFCSSFKIDVSPLLCCIRFNNMSYLETVCKWINNNLNALCFIYFQKREYKLYRNMAQWENKTIEWKVFWLSHKHRAASRASQIVWSGSVTPQSSLHSLSLGWTINPWEENMLSNILNLEGYFPLIIPTFFVCFQFLVKLKCKIIFQEN